MADDDLFDDESSADFDPFSDLEVEEADLTRGTAKSSGGGKRTLAEFSAEVDRRIAVLRSIKQSSKERIAAAQWLGESGDTRAIKALVQVYRHPKSSRGLRRAAKAALSRYKALDEAIFREEGEDVEAALGRAENTWVIELLQELAYNERRPRRRGCGLLVMTGILAILLALLFVIYRAAPTDAVSISEIVRNLGFGATGVPQPTAAPRLDEFGTPLPTETPTPTLPPTETPTPTPEPTATTIPLESVRSQLRDMYAILSRVAAQRGVLDQLRINWDAIRVDPSSGPTMCVRVPPDVPADYELPPGFAGREPALAEAANRINIGLATLRQGWTFWREGCAAGDLPNRIETGTQTVIVAQTAFSEAQLFLDSVPE